MRRLLWIALIASAGTPCLSAEFELAGPECLASILVPGSEPAYVRRAAEDLAGDVEKITGRRPTIVDSLGQCAANTVVLASTSHESSADLLAQFVPQAAQSLKGKWEAYQVQLHGATVGPVRQALVIAGSDARGAMFGLYAFCQHYLGVDPMHFWTDRQPQRRPRLAWSTVRLSSDEPTFRYRGWFINDEDLLTGWRRNAAVREIDYKFYRRVLDPEVAKHIYEALLRLQYNLIIPSSFIDLGNPDEARLVDLAVQRGLLVSMHHQEPLGVTGLYTFPNYFRARGEDVPFSFATQRAKFEEIWREYVRRWSRYGDQVVWQLGLRGKGDRPVWATDSTAPTSDADRGRLISDAMALQWEIVRSIDRRPNPPATSTLWMEGSHLHGAGYLHFPQGVAVIFSDNSPGWCVQPDFFSTQREPGRNYGLYYHQALWNAGPHFCQAVGPHKMHEVFKLAVDHGDTYYALVNVSNVREFPLGLEAAGQLLRNFRQFDPDAFLKAWCGERFAPLGDQAQRCYRDYFASYGKPRTEAAADALPGTTAGGGVAFLGMKLDDLNLHYRLDAQALSVGKKVMGELLSRLEKGKKPAAGRAESLASLLAEAVTHRQTLEAAGRDAPQILTGLDGQAKTFFQVNFVAQQQMMLAFAAWMESAIRADLAQLDNRPEDLRAAAQQAARHLGEVRAAQALASGGKWKDWYAGDELMRVAEAEQLVERLLAAAGGR